MKIRALIATLVLALLASTVGFMYVLGGGPFAEAAEAEVATGVDPQLLASNVGDEEAAADDAGRDGDAEPARRVDEDGAEEDDGADDEVDAGAEGQAGQQAGDDDGDHANEDHADDDEDEDHADDGEGDHRGDHEDVDDHDDHVPPVVDCAHGHVYDEHHDKCVEVPPVVVDCSPGYVYDENHEKCVEIPAPACPHGTIWVAEAGECVPVIIDCIPGYIYDYDLEKCVEVPPVHCGHGFIEVGGECVPVIIDCIFGYIYDYDLEKCVEVPLPVICPLTHFLNDHGECEPFDFEIPGPIVPDCPIGQIPLGQICVDLEIQIPELDPVLPPVQVNPDLLPDLNPELLNPVLPRVELPRLDFNLGG